MKNKYFLTIWIMLLLVLGSVYFIFNKNNGGFEHNGVKVSGQTYHSIQKIFGDNLVRVCNLENGKCIVLLPENKVRIVK